MVLFDLLAPFFSLVDGFLEPFTNVFIRISMWALLSAFITSVVFKKLSNPEKITRLKHKLKSMQNELNNHDGEFSELKTLAIDTIKLSVKRMGLTFFPAMLASIPIIFVLTYLSNNYEFVEPKQDERIAISVTWENTAQSNEFQHIQNNRIIDSGDLSSILWQDNSSSLVNSSNKNKILDLPIALSGIIHKKQWWNALVGNPAGYLDASSQVNSIVFDFTPQEIIHIGPSWMHGWLFVFFFMTLVFSILFLYLFKIKF